MTHDHHDPCPATRVWHMLKDLNAYLECAKIVKGNGCFWSYGVYENEPPKYPAMMVSPEDYLKGWVEHMSQEIETLQPCSERFRVNGLMGIWMEIATAAVEAEEKTRKALEEGVHPHQEADNQRMKTLVLAVQTAVEKVKRIAKEIADAI